MNDDEKLAKEAMKSLFTPAPEDLKESLRRLARAKSAPSAPSLWDGLREAFSGGQWAYGAGAAFAAAAVAVVLVKTVPEREAPKTAEPPPAAAVAPQALAELWSDDDGGDHD